MRRRSIVANLCGESVNEIATGVPRFSLAGMCGRDVEWLLNSAGIICAA